MGFRSSRQFSNLGRAKQETHQFIVSSALRISLLRLSSVVVFSESRSGQVAALLPASPSSSGVPISGLNGRLIRSLRFVGVRFLRHRCSRRAVARPGEVQEPGSSSTCAPKRPMAKSPWPRTVRGDERGTPRPNTSWFFLLPAELLSLCGASVVRIASIPQAKQLKDTLFRSLLHKHLKHGT